MFIYSGGKKYDVNDTVKKEINKMTSSAHYRQRLVGQCKAGPVEMSRCEGDCLMCPYHIHKLESIEGMRLRDDLRIADQSIQSADSKVCCMELLAMMQEIDRDGETLGKLWMAGFTDTEIIHIMKIPRRTYYDRKKRLRIRMKEKLNEYV